MQRISPKPGEASLDILKRCRGNYVCPKDKNGKRLGPLVAYTDRDERGRQYVGEQFIHFGQAEQHAWVLNYFARQLYLQLKLGFPANLQPMWDKIDGFCGTPSGKALATKLASTTRKRSIFLTKEVVRPATKTSSELTRLEFTECKPKTGEQWWIVLDICNNFSTFKKVASLLESYGARVAGIACFLDRSMREKRHIYSHYGKDLQVTSVVNQQILQYKQDDEYVREDVQAGRVIWKPQEEWDQLMAAMAMK